MQGLKESKQAVGAEALTRLQDFAPPTILAQASRLNFSARAYNLLVTNVPGPQFPLYLIGREMQELAPVPFLAPERALAVAIMSYNGNVTIGLMGDYDAMADLDEFGEDVEQSVAELLELARAERSVARRRLPRSARRHPSAVAAGHAVARSDHGASWHPNVRGGARFCIATAPGV